jgi:acyl carrier protein
VEEIEPSRGLSFLSRLFDGGLPPQLGVFPVNWSKFRQQFYRGVPAYLELLLPAGSAAAPSRPASAPSWETLPQTELEPSLKALLRRELAAVLGMADASRVPSRQGFFEIGMDSLMTVELVRRLEANLGLKLPANLAIDYPNMEVLADYLASRLGTVPPQPSVPSAEVLDALPTEELARLLQDEL